MSAGLKRAGTAALIAATMFVCGCDNAQNAADKQVRAELAEARHLAITEPTSDAARAKLVSASENSDASNAVKAEAYAARAQAELDTALSLMRKIQQTELDLSRIGWGIIELAQQIRSSGSAVAGYRKYDPQPVKAAIEAKLTEARGGANPSGWFTHEKAPVPTLATVTQEISRLEGEWAQKNTELNTLNEQRVRLIEQAEQAAAEANSKTGQAALDPFKRASDLRKQSGDVAVQIDLVKNQIARLERNLAVAKGQQAVVNDVITQLQEQISQLDQAWRTYEQRAGEHMQLSARILGTPGSGEVAPGAVGGTISQKAAEVDRLVKELQPLRSDAVAAANSASDFFAKAYDAAQQAVNDYRARPNSSGGGSMDKVLNPLQYRLQQAAVQRVLAELYASEAASIATRIDVRDTVQTAIAGTGLSMPAPLAGADLNDARRNAVSNASLAYKNSDELLGGLIDGASSPELKNMALVSRALNFYGWAQLARQVKDERQATDFINQGKSARDLAFENNAVLPPMPAEFGPPPKRAEPAPEAAPSDQAPPAEGTTPTDAPPAEPGASPAEPTTPAPAPADATTPVDNPIDSPTNTPADIPAR